MYTSFNGWGLNPPNPPLATPLIVTVIDNVENLDPHRCLLKFEMH